MKLGITGIVAAPHTPFGSDGAPATGVVRDQAALLAEASIAGVFICGTTGEGLSLSVEERLVVAEAWKEALPDGMRLLVHVGHNSIAEARRLVDHAQGIGADGIAALSPSFFRPPGPEQLVAFCGEVAGVASRVPFYYYDIPSMTGVDLPMVDFARRAMERIPSFAGIKFTRKDPPEFGRLVELGGDRLDLFFGYDECLIDGLLHGAKTTVGSTYNYAAPLYHHLMKAHADGDIAKAQELVLTGRTILRTPIEPFESSGKMFA